MYRFVGMKQIPKGIKNIIFDLGGVLLDLDVDLSIKAFQQLGLTDVIKPGGWGYHHEVFLKMEQGLLTDNQFREGIRSLLPKSVCDSDIDKAWCNMLIDFAPEKIHLLQQLSSKYKLFLFSNTNSIHITYFQDLFLRKFNFSLSSLFVKDYYSNEIKLRKPAIESFQFVLNDAGLNPQETLFIDDSDKNIEGAKIAGLNTIWLEPNMELEDLFLTSV